MSKKPTKVTLKALYYKAEKYLEGMYSFPYPIQCKICGKEGVDKTQHICISCFGDLKFTYFELDLKENRPHEVFYGRVQLNQVSSLLYFKKATSTQKILHAMKYDNGKDLCVYMGKIMAMKIKESPEFNMFDYLIPVPVHAKKKFDRGYNQSLYLAKGISEELDIPILENILKKAKNNATQTKKSREERVDNVQKAFAVHNSEQLEGKHILLIDDVLTTGATLESCSLAIQNVQPDCYISIYTLAYAL